MFTYMHPEVGCLRRQLGSQSDVVPYSSQIEFCEGFFVFPRILLRLSELPSTVILVLYGNHQDIYAGGRPEKLSAILLMRALPSSAKCDTKWHLDDSQWHGSYELHFVSYIGQVFGEKCSFRKAGNESVIISL